MLQQLHAAAGQDGDAGELRLGLAGDGARDGDDFLSTDFGYGLGLNAHNSTACHSGWKNNGKNIGTKRSLHRDPSLKVRSDFQNVLCGQPIRGA